MRLAQKSWLRRESRVLIIIIESTGLSRGRRNNSVWSDTSIEGQRRMSEIDYHNEQLYALANIQACDLHVRVSRFVFLHSSLRRVVPFVFVAGGITSGS